MKGNKMITLSAKQKRMMEAEAIKEAAWANSPLSAEQIDRSARAVSQAHRMGMGSLSKGKKNNGSSRGGKIAMPVAGSGSGSYTRLRLQKVG